LLRTIGRRFSTDTFFPGGNGLKTIAGLTEFGQRNLVQGFDTLFLLFQPVEHELPLGGVEVHTGDFLRAGDRLDCYVSAR